MDKTISIQTQGEDVRLAIRGDCTIVQAAQLATAMREALNTGSAAYGLDLGEVTEMDSAGLQLLLASRRSCELAGRPWRIVALNDGVQRFLHLLRLDHLAGDAQRQGENHV